jgi:hypothetical protein
LPTTRPSDMLALLHLTAKTLDPDADAKGVWQE